MTKEQFYENVVTGLEKILGEDVTVELQEVTKVNLSLDGVSIRKKDESIAPTIYLNRYFSDYQEGRTMDDIVEEIIRVYENNQPDILNQKYNIQEFYDFKNMEDKIVLKVINTEKNRMLLKDVPHMCMEDLGLSVVFYVSYLIGDVSAGILIRNNHMELWNTNTSELLKLAEKNTNRLHTFTVRGLNQIMEEMYAKNGDAEMAEELFTDNDAIPLYVLTDENNTFGASQLYLKNEIRMFAEVNDCDVIILPSSTQELLLLRSDFPNISTDYLKQMVCDVNKTLREDEFLFDGAFIYLIHEDKIVRL